MSVVGRRGQLEEGVVGRRGGEKREGRMGGGEVLG